MDRYIATPSYTKEILNKYQLYAKKNYGQNFLIDPGVVAKIARNAVSEEQTVIEIGPGIGALTQMLALNAKKVYAFEIDQRLIPVLADTLAPYNNVEVINEDFLNIDLAAFCADKKAVVIAANLPYYITTPLLFKIFESDADIKQITVMMQKEVADRFAANVNTKEYNALSIITQYRCNITTIMKVPKKVFSPAPAIDSAVLQFSFKERDPDIDEKQLFALIKACFKQRRKTILNNYSEYINDKEKAKQHLIQAGIALQSRAEALVTADFIRLLEVNQNED